MKDLYLCKDNGIGKKVNVEDSALANLLLEKLGMKTKFLIDCEGCEDLHSLDYCKKIT
tara:strand:+ start:80 stop:253 length:174 start_codon:yes stop_codon:yes gene_type:complete